MKQKRVLLFFLGVISVISGNLMSKASLVGKAGMSLFYHEYNFLKAWWKGALVLFGILLFIFIVHGIIQAKAAGKAKRILIAAAIFSIIGLYFTYTYFRHHLPHRLLGERFHLGVYLFWIAWTIISLFYLFQIRTNKALVTGEQPVNIKDPV